MSDLEKLAAIRARCVELLELAGKRTPGKWGILRSTTTGRPLIHYGGLARCSEVFDELNAQFIASCAGPAEAGWRATIAAIDLLSQPMPDGWSHPDNPVLVFDHKMADAILTAWEGRV